MAQTIALIISLFAAIGLFVVVKEVIEYFTGRPF